MLLSIAIEKFHEHLENQDRSPETLRGYTLELTHFRDFLAGRHNCPPYLEDIHLNDMEEYLYLLKLKSKSPSGRSRVVYILRSFYRYSVKQDFIRVNWASKLAAVKVEQKERTYLTGTEFEALQGAIMNPIVKNVVWTMYLTGLRIQEALNLTLDDLNFEEKVIRVRQGKGNKDRNIPISKKLQEILRTYLKDIRPATISTRVFVTKNTGKMCPYHVNRELAASAQRAGLKKHVTSHVLRHSFASHLIHKNVSIVRVQRLLGHSNLKTTSIYTHTGMKELSEAVAVFGEVAI